MWTKDEGTAVIERLAAAVAPHGCYFSRINPVTILGYRDVGAQLRDLTRWIFGEAHKYFEGPPENEREGIKIIERPPAELQGWRRHGRDSAPAGWSA